MKTEEREVEDRLGDVNQAAVEEDEQPRRRRRRSQRAASHAQDLQAVVVADGDPVGLRGCPLYVVDLALGRVGQDGVLDGPRHLLDVPDQRLVVVGWREQGGGERLGVTSCSCPMFTPRCRCIWPARLIHNHYWSCWSAAIMQHM